MNAGNFVWKNPWFNWGSKVYWCFIKNSVIYLKTYFYLNVQQLSSLSQILFKMSFYKNLGKFTGKHMCQSLFFNKVAGASCNFIKKEILVQVFASEFCKIFKNIFLTEHLWTTTSVYANFDYAIHVGDWCIFVFYMVTICTWIRNVLNIFNFKLNSNHANRC